MTSLKYSDIKKNGTIHVLDCLGICLLTCLGKAPKYNHLKWTWKMEEWTLNKHNKPLEQECLK